MTDPFDKTLLHRRPVYAVPFASNADVDAPYFPIASPDDQWPSTIPHGLDREVAAALPGLWYCLHMPSTFFELIDTNAQAIKSPLRVRVPVAPP